MLTSATCGSTITKQSIYLNIYGLLYMGLFSLLIQIMSSLAIYFNLVSSLVEVNWFASTSAERLFTFPIQSLEKKALVLSDFLLFQYFLPNKSTRFWLRGFLSAPYRC